MMFEFSDENLNKTRQILAKYPTNRAKSAIMPLLWLAQEQDGDNHLSKDKIEYIAKFLNIPVMEVYEVASFYTMYNLNNTGNYHLQVCGTVPCYLVGSKNILNMCKTILGVDANQVTSDGKFSFSEVECLGACVNAPIVQVNNKEYYENVNSEKIAKIITELSNKQS